MKEGMDALNEMKDILLNNFKDNGQFKEECLKEINKLKNNKKIINYLNNTLKELLTQQTINSADYTINWKIKAIEELLKNYERIDLINKKEINKNDDLMENKINNKKKLNWTGQKNILIYLFQQLKKEKGNENNFLITNSYEDIAIFLQNNFNCFEDNELSTIIGQLKKTTPPKKISKKITIEI